MLRLNLPDPTLRVDPIKSLTTDLLTLYVGLNFVKLAKRG